MTEDSLIYNSNEKPPCFQGLNIQTEETPTLIEETVICSDETESELKPEQLRPFAEFWTVWSTWSQKWSTIQSLWQPLSLFGSCCERVKTTWYPVWEYWGSKQPEWKDKSETTKTMWEANGLWWETTNATWSPMWSTWVKNWKAIPLISSNKYIELKDRSTEEIKRIPAVKWWPVWSDYNNMMTDKRRILPVENLDLSTVWPVNNFPLSSIWSNLMSEWDANKSEWEEITVTWWEEMNTTWTSLKPNWMEQWDSQFTLWEDKHSKKTWWPKWSRWIKQLKKVMISNQWLIMSTNWSQWWPLPVEDSKPPTIWPINNTPWSPISGNSMSEWETNKSEWEEITTSFFEELISTWKPIWSAWMIHFGSQSTLGEEKYNEDIWWPIVSNLIEEWKNNMEASKWWNILDSSWLSSFESPVSRKPISFESHIFTCLKDELKTIEDNCLSVATTWYKSSGRKSDYSTYMLL